MLHQSLVKASSHGDGNPWGMGEVLGLRLAYDILLHETIHQYLHQQNLYTPTDDAHRCQVWINELNRITQLLDLPYYFTQLRKTTKRVPVTGSEIQGKYCNVETHRVLQQPKKVVSVWVPQDEDVITVAESQQLQLATHKQLITFPYSIRPVDYYSADEKALLQSIFEDIDT